RPRNALFPFPPAAAPANASDSGGAGPRRRSPTRRDHNGMAPADRPLVTESFHTDDLPATPQRDRTLPADLWEEAPPELRALGEDIDEPLVAYKRRIGTWLLWRAGPASRGHARYMALRADDLGRRFTFRLFPDGSGEGVGPDGQTYQRFRLWKEA